jgi:adenylate cyclase
MAIWNFYPRGPSIEPASIEPEQAPAVSEVEEAPKTIAVLPFDDLSPEKDQEYFVYGLSEELLNTLTKIPDLLVTARTSSFAFKGTGKTVQEIASVLGVDNILEGSVRKAGNSLRITAQLVRASDGFHLWSENYDRELKDIFAVQEDIATAVADELKAKLGIGKSFKQLGATENIEAYELYLVAKGHDNAFERDRALEFLDAAIALDPEYASAWALKANAHNSLAAFSLANQSTAQRDLAILAAQKAIELEPHLGAAYYSLGYIKASTGDWIEAELLYRKAMELITESMYENPAFFNLQVGHFKKANELYEVTRQYDPLNQNVRANYIRTFGHLGDYERFDDEYEHANELLKGKWSPLGLMNLWLVGLGDYDSISRDKMVWSHPICDIGREHLDSPEEGLAEMRRIYAENKNLSSSENIYVSLWAAYFGDPELAMDAMEKGISIDAGGIFVLWYPAMREVRKTPRFKKFVREIGLVDYWKEFGWPDLCRPIGDDDFVCD